ncbi:ribonuclease H-like domain-containing protein [Tanacetum coccineum]
MAPPTPASPSSAQIHSLVQQPSPMAQHTPVQLQFSPTAISYQTITVSDQHAFAIIQNPPVNPNPDSVHPMVTRFRVGTNRPTERLNLHVSSVSPLPKSYHDAFNDPNWQNDMPDEYTALIKNKTRTLVPKPSDTNIVRCIWLFRHTYMADGTLSRYKARLVANGSTQLEGVNVDETFSPELDVKNAFLHGDLSKTVYMHQPPRFRDSVLPDYGADIAYLLLYVDDIVLTASSESLLQQIIGSLPKEFAITDMGLLNYFLGISVTRDSSGVDGDPVSDPTLYRSLAGSLQYLTFTRPDISYVVQQLADSSYTFSISSSSSSSSFNAEKELDMERLSFLDELPVDIEAGCPTTQRSTSGYCVFLGNNLLSWSSKRQPTLSHSSAEAKYRGVSNVVAETCWLRNLLLQHQRSKHIEIDIHFVRDLVAAGQVRVLHVPSRYQFADILTKGLSSALFEVFRSSLSVRCPPAQTAREC